MTTPTTVPVRLKLRQDTAANWTSVNPTLLAGELGRESDTGKIKIGNGSSTWTALAYQAWATLPVAVNAGGTGQTTYTNGQLLIGNTTGNTLTKATLTAGSGVAITNGTGSITVAASNIANAQISASAAIVDTKLATIATAGKVSNSATTADNANTASAIVARDASGNFSAGTITAALTGAASSNVLKAGDTMTGALVVPLASASTPSLTFTGDLDTGVFSPGADQVTITTNGTARLYVASDGKVGIGTTIPDERLHIAAGASSSIRLGQAGGDFAYRLRANVTGSVDGGFLIEDAVNGNDLYQTISGPSGRHVFSIDDSEKARITTTGALLVGTTATPTGAGSGAVVAQDRVVISSAGAGRHQVIVGDTGIMTATTGTIEFKFKSSAAASARACYVKLAIANRNNNNTPSNLPAAEYAFQLHNTSAGACSLNGATTIFEFTYVYATHVAFADLGSGECTVTLTNPVTSSQTGSYKVEVLTQGGVWTLDSVTTT